MTACEIYCGGYFVDEDCTKIPSCLCKATELCKNKKNKYFNVRRKLKNMKNQDIWLYQEWLEEVRETVEIHRKVVEEHLEWKKKNNVEDDTEYYPAYVPVPEDTKIPYDHYYNM